MLGNLCLDLLRCVGHKNSGAVVACGHFRVQPLKSREKFGVQDGWFLVANTWAHISSHSEVRVLINGVRNKAWNVSTGAEDFWEGVRIARNALKGWVRDFTYVVRALKAEYSLNLVEGYMFLSYYEVLVEFSDVLRVGEDERFIDVEATGDDVFCVFTSIPLGFFQGKLRAIQILLIVRHLYDDWHVKGVL